MVTRAMARIKSDIHAMLDAYEITKTKLTNSVGTTL
jgi:hypothetical protein